jgi:hypothetical protein
MGSSESGGPPSRASRPDHPANRRLWKFLVPRRRRFIVNWRYQLKASLFGVSLALIMLSLVNLNVYFTNRASTESILVVNPELRTSLEVRDRRQVIELALGSVVVTLAIFALGIFQSHKTAGAAFSLRRTLLQLRDGQYDATPRLRRDDNLQELLAPIGDLARALRDTTAAEISTLQAVVESLGKEPADPPRREAAARLRNLIQEKTGRLGRPAPEPRSPSA